MTKRKEFLRFKICNILGKLALLHMEVVDRLHSRDFTWRQWSKKERAFLNSMEEELMKIERSVVQFKNLRCL